MADRCDSYTSLSNLANFSVVDQRKKITPQESSLSYLCRVVSAEIAFGLLILSSTVELVIYAALGLLSLALSPISNTPFRFFVALAADDTTALVSVTFNFFYYNLFGDGLHFLTGLKTA